MSFLDDITYFAEDVFDFFAEVIEGIIDFIVWVFVTIVSFFNDIADYFMDLVPLGKVSDDVLRDDKTEAIVLNMVEDRLDSGKFKRVPIGLKKKKSKGIILKGLYDKEKKQFVEGTTEINEYEKLDEETRNQLGDSDMLIIE